MTCISNSAWIDHFQLTIFHPSVNVAPNFPCNRFNNCQLFMFQLFLPITAGSDLMQLENKLTIIIACKVWKKFHCTIVIWGPMTPSGWDLELGWRGRGEACFIIIKALVEEGDSWGKFNCLSGESSSRACFIRIHCKCTREMPSSEWGFGVACAQMVSSADKSPR